MKNKNTLWVAFLNTPTEQEIQEAANEMKDGKAYLFKDSEGELYLYNQRRIIRNGYTFIKKVQAN